MRKSTLPQRTSLIPTSTRARSNSFDRAIPPRRLEQPNPRRSTLQNMNLCKVTNAAGNKKGTVPAVQAAFGMNKRDSRKTSGASASGFGRPSLSAMGFGRPSLSAMDFAKKLTITVRDKAFQKKCTRRLYDFLNSKHYPNLSSKTLKSLDSRDILQIFEFLYKILDPEYTLPDRKAQEEEIPQCFLDLGCPIHIQKANMKTIGSPHSWPLFIAALDWLGHLVNMYLKMQDHDPCQADFDAPLDEQYFMDYMSKTYEVFMNLPDDVVDDDKINYKEVNNELKEKTIGNASHDIEELEKRVNDLVAEYEQLQREEDSLPILKKELEEISNDEKVFQDHLEKMAVCVKAKEDDNNQLKRLIQSTEVEIKFIHQDSKDKMSVVKSQEVNLSEFEELMKEYESINQEKRQVQGEIENVRLDIGSCEMEVSKNNITNEQNCLEYNNICRRAGLIRAKSENASGQDFELRLTFDKGTNLLDFLKTKLNKKLKEIKEEVRNTECELSLEKTAVDRLTDLVEEVETEHQEVLTKIAEADRDFENRKEILNKKLTQFRDELKKEEQERKLMTNEDQKMKLDAALNELNIARENLKKVSIDIEAKQHEATQAFLKVCNLALDFRAHVIKNVIEPQQKSAKIVQRAFKEFDS